MRAVSVAAIDIRDTSIARAIHALQQRAYRVEARRIGFADLPPLRESLAELADSAETFLAAYDGGEIIGALAYSSHGEEAQVCRLMVEPARFGEGIASLLLVALEAAAPHARALRTATAADNLPAIRCYRRHGYCVDKSWNSREGLALVQLVKHR